MRTLKTIAAIATFALITAGLQAQSNPTKFPTVLQQPEFRYDGNPSGEPIKGAVKKPAANQRRAKPSKPFHQEFSALEPYAFRSAY